jgi:hypothetical protein
LHTALSKRLLSSSTFIIANLKKRAGSETGEDERFKGRFNSGVTDSTGTDVADRDIPVKFKNAKKQRKWFMKNTFH